jgi:hypothetical protein
MRQTLASVDDVLIERLFQPASDVLTHRVGLSRTTAPYFFTDLASLAWIVSRVPEMSALVAAWDAGAAFLVLALLLLGLGALVSLRMVFQRTERTLSNPLRRVMRPHRAIVLLMLVSSLVQLRAPGLANIADLVMLLGIASALYLGACAERPPIRRDTRSMVPAPGSG